MNKHEKLLNELLQAYDTYAKDPGFSSFDKKTPETKEKINRVWSLKSRILNVMTGGNNDQT